MGSSRRSSLPGCQPATPSETSGLRRGRHGPDLTNRLRRSTWSGTGGITEPLTVDLYVDPDLAAQLPPESFVELAAVSAPAIMTDRLEPDLLRGNDPVEHLISGASNEYVRERLRIARTAYRVQRVVNERIEQ
jgi:hypothetical protein